MTHIATRALLLLLGLLELRVLLCQREYCGAGKRCYAAVTESADFPGAQKICKSRGGDLMTLTSPEAQEMATRLLRGLSGRYWLGLRLPDGRCPDLSSRLLGYAWTTGDGTADHHNWGTADANCSHKCASVFAERNLTWWQESCRDKLTGLLCQYTMEGPCSALQVGGDQQVTYTTPMGTHGESLARFPPGTIALKQSSGVEYPDSKYLCFETWLQAPWNCEVNNGGCEHSCNSSNQMPLCACPVRQTLQPNNITCAKDLCSECEHRCHQVDGAYVCACEVGYQLAQDKKGCVDVNECEDEDRCQLAKNEVCRNTAGGFECVCRDGFSEEDGECVDISICFDCEHMDCRKSESGVHVCVCRPGFRVSEKDPTKCEKYCGEQDCPASCIPNPDQPDASFCDCPDGYVKDIQNDMKICTDINECDIKSMCDHQCVNSYGSYRCLCNDGFKLQKGHKCVPTKKDEKTSGSKSPQPTSPPAAHAQPAAVPSYVKTGSALGIGVFLALCVALLCLAVRHALKRCRSFELTAFKRDMDIFYLQQVTTEKYKRFSFDKQSKSDLQRL